MRTSHAQGAHYPIRAVSKLTGISLDTLRVWERRYGAVKPARDARGRLYSAADVARLRRLTQALAAGHSIGRVASLSDARLQRLTAESAPAASMSVVGTAFDSSRLRRALARLDSSAIEQELSRLATVLAPIELVQGVLLPSLRVVGDEWHTSTGGISREHLMSATAGHLLGSFLRLHSTDAATTRLLFATPSHERHELGLLAAAMLAAARGLRVTYLGADLPAREIVHAARASAANVVVVGVTMDDRHRTTGRQLLSIARGLSANVEFWAGGPGARRHAQLLDRRGLVLDHFDEYVRQLDRLEARVG